MPLPLSPSVVGTNGNTLQNNTTAITLASVSAGITAYNDITNDPTSINNTTTTINTKYHCELAGEGIEYAWGLIKREFRDLEHP